MQDGSRQNTGVVEAGLLNIGCARLVGFVGTDGEHSSGF